jgi:hypothetical protein
VHGLLILRRLIHRLLILGSLIYGLLRLILGLLGSGGSGNGLAAAAAELCAGLISRAAIRTECHGIYLLVKDGVIVPLLPK